MVSFLPLWQVWVEVVVEVSNNPPCYVLSFMFFPATHCALPQMSQTFQHVANFGLGSAKFQLVRRGQHPKTTLVFAPSFPVYLHHPCACSIISCIGFSSPHAPRQKRVGKFKCCWRRVKPLPVALASLNNNHNSGLRAYCVGLRLSSRASLVLVRPLRLRNSAW
jgi:hypothetical protein